ncbi:Actin-binding protein IPP [Papilio xuthus]|uniref:Actin-binding protein IPP n=1 Tax=Papilio xuthus TaxID=66420 RepID=A0A194PFI2_PAPXU|nr:Actin-binding protein IPP [Papilio xuthus]
MSNLYEKLPCKEGSRPYKCVEFGTKVSLKLNNLRKDGRFCDIDLISGSTKVKKTGRGALVSLAAEPRARSRRVLLVAGGSCHANSVLPSFVSDNILSTNTWEEVASLRQARAGCAAGAADGVLVAAGGDSESDDGDRAFYRARTTLASVEVYEPAENAWRSAPSLPHVRAEAGAALL